MQKYCFILILLQFCNHLLMYGQVEEALFKSYINKGSPENKYGVFVSGICMFLYYLSERKIRGMYNRAENYLY